MKNRESMKKEFVPFGTIDEFKMATGGYQGGPTKDPLMPPVGKPYDAKQEHKEYLSTVDPVNHPSHYTTGKYEVIDILEDKLSPEEFKGFLKGNVLKYILRAEHKNGMEDYRKAQFYLNKLVGDK